MTTHAQRLPIRQLVPLTAQPDRHDVVRVRLLLPITHTPALAARPSVTRQHRLTPSSVGLAAVASSCCVGP